MTIRSLEDNLHEMEKQELGLLNRLRGKEVLDENIAKMRKEVTSFTELIKVSVERGIMTYHYFVSHWLYLSPGS